MYIYTYIYVYIHAQTQYLGKTKYMCDCYVCVPKYHVFDRNNSFQYVIRPDTCCGGCCIKCECGGSKGWSSRAGHLVCVCVCK